MKTVWVGFGEVRVEPAPLLESRINHLGLQLGPAPPDDGKSYDERQLPTNGLDAQGNELGGL